MGRIDNGLLYTLCRYLKCNKLSINGKALTFTADFMIPDDNGFNKGNGIIAFGEKVQNIEAGKTYSYKLTLTPDSEGKYTAKASVNGTEYELDGTNLPTVEEMSAYTFAMIAEKANPYNINASCKKDNKYQNNKTIVLLDNLSLTVAVPVFESDILFSDDFSDYTSEYIEKAEANELSYYNTDKYILHNWQSSVSYPNGKSNECICRLCGFCTDAEVRYQYNYDRRSYRNVVWWL